MTGGGADDFEVCLLCPACSDLIGMKYFFQSGLLVNFRALSIHRSVPEKPVHCVKAALTDS